MKKLGFTLIEMIVTILVVSIMFLAIAGFLELGTKGYADSAKRQALQNQARFAIEKMSREIRHGVPNSFKNETNQCLVFYPIKYSGFYVERPLSSAIQFVIGNDNAPTTLNGGEYLVVNPSQFSDLDTTSSASINVSPLTSTANVYTVSSSLPSQSVGRRHYIYEPDKLVRYCIDTDGFIQKQIGVSAAVKIAENVVSGAFRYEDASLVRGGLVHIELSFEQNDERSEYKHDVQVLNVP